MDGSFSKLSPLIFITLLCLGTVEIGYLAIEHYILILPSKTETVREQNKKTVMVSDEKKNFTKNIKVILKRNLFGAPDSEKSSKKPALPVEANIEASDLEIILMGTANDGIDGNRAFILDKKSRKQQIYRVGDSIEGALIGHISRGKVILTYDGNNEVIDMSEAANVRSNYRGSKKSQPVQPKSKLQRPRKRVKSRTPSPAKKRTVLPGLDMNELIPQ